MIKMIVKSILVTVILFYSSANAQPVIFLNGTTTSGKSSIAKELEKLLIEQQHEVAIVAIDDFVVPAVQKELAWRWVSSFSPWVASVNLISPDEMKEIALGCRIKLCVVVKEAYALGKTVIIDDVMYRDDQVDFYNKAFQGFNVHRVLVYCPISTLVHRVIHRNNSSGLTGQRSLYQALDQFSHIYKKKETKESCIDMLSKSDLEAACSKALDQHTLMQSKIPDLLKGVQNAICPFSLDQIQQTMLEKFAFKNYRDAMIGPSIEYNCRVNSERDNSAICAAQIMESLGL